MRVSNPVGQKLCYEKNESFIFNGTNIKVLGVLLEPIV